MTATAAGRPNPRVSVVIPTFNRARDVGRCLDSLLAQTFRDFEVLVCDDGSTDGTAEVVAAYRGRLDLGYHWAENFGGAARPRNRGVDLARGAYVAFLDSDDWWAPDKLARSVERLDAGADLVYHDLYLARGNEQHFFWRKLKSRVLAAPVFQDLLHKGNVVPASSVVVRRELIKRVGGFGEDRSLIAWEDYDAWLRIAKLTERFERLDGALGYYWWGGGNISSPNRTISTLEQFDKAYLSALMPAEVPAWYHYTMGLACHDLGRHRIALRHMSRAIVEGLTAGRCVRALLTIAHSLQQIVVGARAAPAP